MLKQEPSHFLMSNDRQVSAQITPAELLALQVIYGEDDQAAASWKQFRNDGFDVDSLYLSRGQAVLPLLSKRLSSLFPEDPWLGKMQGYSRYTLTRNIFLLNTLQTITSVFRQHNIKSAIFGDAALLLDYYKVLGTRPIENLALLVDDADFEKTENLASKIEIPEMVPERKPGYRPLKICRSMHEVKLDNVDIDSSPVQFAEHVFQVLNAPNLLLILLLDVYNVEHSQSQWFMDTALVLNSCSKAGADYIVQKIKSMRLAKPTLQSLTFFQHTAQTVYFDTNDSMVAARLHALITEVDELAQHSD